MGPSVFSYLACYTNELVLGDRTLPWHGKMGYFVPGIFDDVHFLGWI